MRLPPAPIALLLCGCLTVGAPEPAGTGDTTVAPDSDGEDCDDAAFLDADGDGFGDPAAPMSGCDDGVSLDATDCDDADPAVHPGAVEVCGDGVDNDCSGDARACGLRGERAAADADAFVAGTTEAEQAGLSQAVADLNGDGRVELLVGAAFFDNRGRVAVFDGPIEGDTTLDRGEPWHAPGDSAGFGASVAAAGDLDGDGTEDVVIGGFGEQPYAGLACVVYGGAEPAGCAGSVRPAGTRLFAYTVAGVGDVTGDGVADWVQGSPEDSVGEDRAGVVWLFPGDPTRLTGAHAAEDLAVATIRGDEYYAYVGARGGGGTVSGGDLDGDGVADLSIGQHLLAWDRRGSANVFLGGAGLRGQFVASDADLVFTGGETDGGLGWLLMAEHDLDGDGYADLVASEHGRDAGVVSVVYGSGSPAFGVRTLASAAGATVVGAAEGDALGAYGAIGDMNGDGSPDIALSAWRNRGHLGAVYGLYGPLTAGGSWAAADAPLVLRGDDPLAGFGEGEIRLGDHDGDGTADLFVPSPTDSDAAEAAGGVSIFYQVGL